MTKSVQAQIADAVRTAAYDAAKAAGYASPQVSVGYRGPQPEPGTVRLLLAVRENHNHREEA